MEASPEQLLAMAEVAGGFYGQAVTFVLYAGIAVALKFMWDIRHPKE